ncbi:hypothetical protein HMI54_014948 [Coelomomyces lativittatus]|nr:hypothetical protein HMI55_003861 [Coelomomyces lativittatus]KAJ1502531.1 hypothetical protein HMI56_002635 [Coelomomyces lativittatus]KAJ1518570.1 hypothetical protein HMI54_014948 [Coelomomyces lativittatus]
MNSNLTLEPFMELSCQVMTYEWGQKGSSSLVAQLANQNFNLTIEPFTSYAELWIGTHPNAPSTLKHVPSKNLLDYLHEVDPTLPDLPYLLKVLSVAKPLSIQAHPDITLATHLFQTQPDVYKDPNHKPEMAIALTRFEMLFGFLPWPTWIHHFRLYPELLMCTPYASSHEMETLHPEPSNQVVKAVVKGFVEASTSTVEKVCQQLVLRFTHLPHPSSLESLFLQIHSHFPGDVGTLFVFLMHHVVLQPGQALFMGANELHAYLYGDCVEVMATSDNVIRAGLTPKYKDVTTLLSMLNYTCRSSPDAFLLQPERLSMSTLLYNPPIQEFTIHHHSILPSLSEPSLVPVVNAWSLLLVIKGLGTICENSQSTSTPLHPGSIFLVKKQSILRVQALEPLEIFQAFCDDETLVKK